MWSDLQQAAAVAISKRRARWPHSCWSNASSASLPPTWTSSVRACGGQTLADVHQIVSPLVAGGWLTQEQEFSPSAWAIDPRVHVRFADRARQEAN
jgi:hypothetical protein